MSEHEWDATRPIGPSRPLPPPPEAAHRPRTRGRTRGRSLPAALALTVLNTVVPGTAFLAAGRRRLGVITLATLLLLVGGAAWLATAGRRTAAQIAVDPTALTWVFGGILVVGLLWVAVVVAGYRMLLPPRTSRGGQVVGGVLVAALVAALAYPIATAGQVTLAHRGLLDGLFADRDSATVEDTPDPFGDQERLNVLLLGGDGGEGREGVRTDTVIVASMDTSTGDTVLFSLPRNLQDLPFPEDSPLAEVYPEGFEGANESDSLLNAVYRTGPAWYPDILGPTDDPGADFLKLGVGEALGLPIHYFVLVNLDGFSRLVDALGGITVNVNYWVPINGIVGEELPDDYIAPGPDQHMDGERALDFARGRYGLSDYDRMARQRCAIKAIIDAADPVTLLQRYQRLAATTKDIVSTDIPRSALDDFVDLAFLVKDAEIRSVVFDDTVIDPAYPDYDRIRAIAEEAIDPAPAADDAPTNGIPAPSATPSPAPSPTPSAAPSAGATTDDPAAVTDIGDACAYDPVRAAEARAAGEPPNQAD
ncbi:LytR family transcriptional regulator [Geodermatophilus sp. DF01-2]|uniref:LCP family glycopolymer transferase n=1 Tax=Geodermatophilus sp. DF01-2 TaxID=2559610 RepID=UPI0010747487|nr:LCP family protein [Geodermatophilus sp. DF01_2]TFV62722.1 LytR family transcriptional regulator [Geodermatophilus sp. DF01_2]